jgi:hypothetical protein
VEHSPKSTGEANSRGHSPIAPLWEVDGMEPPLQPSSQRSRVSDSWGRLGDRPQRGLRGVTTKVVPPTDNPLLKRPPP